MPTALSNGWLVSAMWGPRDVYPRWEVLPMWVAEQTGVNWTVLKRWRTCWGSKQKPPDAEGSNFSQTYLYNQGEAREYITHTSKCSLACGSHCPWGTQKFRMEKQTMVRWVGRSMTRPPGKENGTFVGYIYIFFGSFSNNFSRREMWLWLYSIFENGPVIFCPCLFTFSCPTLHSEQPSCAHNRMGWRCQQRAKIKRTILIGLEHRKKGRRCLQSTGNRALDNIPEESIPSTAWTQQMTPTGLEDQEQRNKGISTLTYRDQGLRPRGEDECSQQGKTLPGNAAYPLPRKVFSTHIFWNVGLSPWR